MGPVGEAKGCLEGSGEATANGDAAKGDSAVKGVTDCCTPAAGVVPAVLLCSSSAGLNRERLTAKKATSGTPIKMTTAMTASIKGGARLFFGWLNLGSGRYLGGGAAVRYLNSPNPTARFT